MSERKKVLLATSTFGELDAAPREKLTANGFEIVDNPHRRKLTKEELIVLLPGVIGIIAGLETLDREVLAGSELKVISRCGVEMSNVDLDAARELGITVRNTPDTPTTAVAELTVGAMLGLLRQIPFMDRELHEGRWTKKIGVQFSGKTVAIIGFGRIGRYVAKLIRPFGCDIIAIDSALEGTVEATPVVSLGEALGRADIVTLHVSGEACIIGKKELDLMKEGVYILNAARGGVIDEEALREAIDNGRVAGAWLDAFSEEPYRGPLVGCPQVILTPHVGSYSIECRRSMEMAAVENLLEAFGSPARPGKG